MLEQEGVSMSLFVEVTESNESLPVDFTANEHNIELDFANNEQIISADFASTETDFSAEFEASNQMLQLDFKEGSGNAQTSEEIKKAVEEYLSKNPIASPAKIGTVTLLASAWIGSNNLYKQIVNIEGVTENSQVDLTPDVQQLAIFYEKDLTFVTENENGIVTVYIIGQKPLNDYTMQVTITEVLT